LDSDDLCGTNEDVKRSTIGRVKDAALQKAVLMLLRPKLERYGHIRELKVDTTAKVVTAEIQLLGEPQPLTIHEAYYRVEKHGNQAVLIVHGIKVSKPWVQNLIDDQMPEISVKIPDMVRSLID
jgi:hypothetical protein